MDGSELKIPDVVDPKLLPAIVEELERMKKEKRPEERPRIQIEEEERKP